MLSMASKVSVALAKKIFLDFVKIGSFAARDGARAMSSAQNSAEKSPKGERKIDVSGIEINYCKVGNGKHPVLLLPGALGTIWTDFKPQLEHFATEDLTLIAWDPPGYGKSRPPNRTFPINFFERDAMWAHDLMRELKYDKYSLVGWSDGAITSLIFASLYPENMIKLVSVAGNAYVLPEEMKMYQSIRDINKWSERMRAPLLEIYGEDYFRKTWSAWVECMDTICKEQNGDICRAHLQNIKCPTLIIHGGKDAMVNAEHPTYLKEHIQNSEVKIFEKGSHNLHLRYYEEFNAVVREFLLRK